MSLMQSSQSTVLSHPKIPSTTTNTPPVINAPNNRIKIQNVFSFRPNIVQSCVNPITSAATAKPSEITAPTLAKTNQNTQPKMILPSLPTIQAIASLAMNRNGVNRPIVSTASSSTERIQIRAIPTAALTAQPSQRTSLPKTNVLMGNTRILLQRPKPAPSSLLPISSPLMNQSVTNTTSTTMAAIVQPNTLQSISFSQAKTQTGLQIRPIQLQSQAQSQMQPQSQSPVKSKLLLIRRPDGTVVVTQPIQAVGSAKKSLVMNRASLNPSDLQSNDNARMQAVKIAAMINKRNSLGTTTIKKIVSPRKNAMIAQNRLVVKNASVSTKTAPELSKSTVATTHTNVDKQNIHCVDSKGLPRLNTTIKLPTQTSSAAAGDNASTSATVSANVRVSASACDSAGAIKLPVKNSTCDANSKAKVPAKMNRPIVERTAQKVPTIDKVHEPVVPELIEISDDDDNDDIVQKSGKASTSMTNNPSATAGQSKEETKTKNIVTPQTKISALTAQPTQSTLSNSQSAPMLPVVNSCGTGEEKANKKSISYPISGFLISDNMSLGKLSARMYVNHIIVQIPGIKSNYKFQVKNVDALSTVDNYLDTWVYYKYFVYVRTFWLIPNVRAWASSIIMWV